MARIVAWASASVVFDLFAGGGVDGFEEVGGHFL
jgi:hypothetical protein